MQVVCPHNRRHCTKFLRALSFAIFTRDRFPKLPVPNSWKFLSKSVSTQVWKSLFNSIFRREGIVLKSLPQKTLSFLRARLQVHPSSLKARSQTINQYLGKSRRRVFHPIWGISTLFSLILLFIQSAFGFKFSTPMAMNVWVLCAMNNLVSPFDTKVCLCVFTQASLSFNKTSD